MGVRLETQEAHHRKLVLVVDDSIELLAAVRNALEPRGFDVLEASSPFAGVRLAATHSPDAIVMDLDMPGMDGFEALRYLKRIPQTRDIPVIAFTAHFNIPDDRFMGGFERIVPKAAGLENLENEIAEVLDTFAA